jgi:VIT1/CCC1 family predicted Fe2+/Mn2+ transporter
MLRYKGTRALDELVGPNKGKIRLISRADEKTYKKGKRSGSIFRAERVNIIHQMTTEEARTTEVSITRTARGRYENAHIRYDINDGLIDVILEVIPTEEQKSERARNQKEKRDKRNMTKEEEHEIKEKYRPRSDEDA